MSSAFNDDMTAELSRNTLSIRAHGNKQIFNTLMLKMWHLVSIDAVRGQLKLFSLNFDSPMNIQQLHSVRYYLYCIVS